MNATQEQIVALAEQLIRTRGYNAFSYKDIADALHVKNAAIHYYFPSKTDLGVGVMQGAIQRFYGQKAAWENLPEDQQIRNFMEVFADSRSQGLICLVGSMSPDYDTLPVAVQEKLNLMCGELVQWVAQQLENGRKKGLLHFEGDAYNRALLITTNMQASLLLSRVLGDDVFQRMRNQLIQDMM